MWILRLARDAARLPARDRGLAVRAIAWLVLSCLALHTASFSRLLAVLRRIPSRRLRADGATEGECRVALERAVRLFPGSTCLARALAGAALLRRERRPSRLNIHVHLDSRRRFAAHASLIAGDLVIAGAGTEMQWSVLLTEHFEP